ncbi:WD40 repeat-like protein [Myriangium duriaei CBS 260.36]|uniref:WD40 repeat-like protein n=1 Tax=Myriangium duriaei CBS 260.36 TaxID=1168546 RepID=A0A9P4MLN6_9PEZI|nr:WD40 repeat-like protein [Myriangium duriaei CBS 260.36]
MLQHVGGSVPITALSFAGKVLLSGEGGTLKIFQSTNRSLISSLVIFEDCSIHGVVCYGKGPAYTVLVWGGPLVTLLELTISNPLSDNANVNIRLITKPVTCPDWVLHGQFCPGKAAAFPRIALITAHNALLFFDHDPAHGTSQLSVATTQSRSILYSATISWETQSRILIASGTVFGQIIVWTAHVGPDSISTTLHKVFTGHEGSPFGLQISVPQLSANLHGVARFIASCSDDRSVRLWDISDLSTISVDPHAAIDYSSLVGGNGEHTGYNDQSVTLDHAASGCFARAMGHLSRIWAVNIFHSSNTYVVTFGEDATCHIWVCEPTTSAYASTRPAELRLVQKLDCHGGKHIWSHAMRADNEGQIQIATGGADGSIAIHHLPSEFDFPGRSDNLTGCIEPVTTHTQKTNQELDKIRSYTSLTADAILASTNDGHVYEVRTKRDTDMTVKNLKTAGTAHWVYQESDLAGFCMTASVPSFTLAFLAGKSGSVYMYHSTCGLSKILSGSRKTAGIFARDCSDLLNTSCSAACLVTWLNSPVAALLQVSIVNAGGDSSNAYSSNSLLLSLPLGETVTTFAPVMADKHGELIAVGFRSGSVVFYNLKAGAQSQDDVVQIQSFGAQQLHTDAITDLLVLSGANRRILASTCRDGSYSMAVLDISADTTSAEVVHCLQVPAMTEAYRLYIQSGHLYIAGFRRKYFVVWNADTEQEIFSIDCGGSNRSWIYQPSTESQEGLLTWTQASEMHVKAVRSTDVIRIDGGGHGREIKAVSSTNQCCVGQQIVATGSEDTDIKLSKVEFSVDNQVSLRCLRTLRKHNTGVQDLCWSDDGCRLISSGGMEELFVWRITELAELGVGVRCESTCPFTSAIPDLRVTSVSARTKSTSGSGSDSALVIAASRSDSTIQIYDYGLDHGTSRWTCIYAGTYLACALTNVMPIPHPQGLDYLAMATDGHGVIFGADSTADTRIAEGVLALDWSSRFKVHQSASHCAEVMALDDSDFILVSGGDDNSLSVSRIHYGIPGDSKKSYEGSKAISTLTIPRAHTAAITALHVISRDLSQGKMRVVTGSLDQKFKMWEISVNKHSVGVQGLEIIKLCSMHTPVADIAALCSWTEEQTVWMILCGVGWDSWRTGLY